MTPVEHGQGRAWAIVEAERNKRAKCEADKRALEESAAEFEAKFEQAAAEAEALEAERRALVEAIKKHRRDGRRKTPVFELDAELYAALDRIQSPETPPDPG